MGIEPGVAPEEWVIDAPDRVQELHRRFVEAGSDIVLTCTFGGTGIVRIASEAPNTASFGFGIAVQADGAIVVAGSRRDILGTAESGIVTRVTWPVFGS